MSSPASLTAESVDSASESDESSTTPRGEQIDAPRRKHRSVSQLLSYSQCGESFRLQRRTDAPQRPAGWFSHGRAYHAAIEAWEKSGRKIRVPELNELFLAEYRASVKADIESVGGVENIGVFMVGGNKRVETDLADREVVGWFQVQQYIEQALEQKHLWEVVESEFEFRFDLHGVEMFGFIDQVRVDLTDPDRLPYPVDLKSGAKIPPTPVQLAVYNFALQNIGTRTTGFAEWVHAGRPATARVAEKPTKTIRVDLTDWPEERVGHWLKSMDESERAGIYLPSPTDSCTRTCSVSQWCRAVSNHLGSVKQYAGDLLAPYNNEETA